MLATQQGSPAQPLKHFLQLFIKSKSDTQDESADLIDASALRGELKAAPVTQACGNVLRIDPAIKAASKEKRFRSKVYVGTVHASLKFLPNRNWYPGARCRQAPARVFAPFLLRPHPATDLHAEMRRSLQKFESLTKALGKIKGAPKVVNLADENGTDSKSTKLPKIHAAHSQSENASIHANDHELFNQLTLLDHLLRLPAEQLRASSQRCADVAHAGLILPVAQPPRNGPTGVSLFSSAAALSDRVATSTSLQQQENSLDSPSRSVTFAASDAGLVKVHIIPSADKVSVRDVGQDTLSKPPPTKVSPRIRAIKLSAGLANDSASSTALDLRLASGSESHVKHLDSKPVKAVGALLDAKVAYGSARLGSKGKLVPQVPGAVGK